MAITRIPLTALNPNGNGVTVTQTVYTTEGHIFQNDGHVILLANQTGAASTGAMTILGVSDPYARDGSVSYDFGSGGATGPQVAIFGPLSTQAFTKSDGDTDISTTGAITAKFTAFRI